LQHWLDRSGVWPRLGGGCHCGRDSVASIAAAGFQVAEVEPFPLGPGFWVSNPHVRGRARKAPD
jgi:hypothetical protein